MIFSPANTATERLYRNRQQINRVRRRYTGREIYKPFGCVMLYRSKLCHKHSQQPLSLELLHPNVPFLRS